MREQEMLRLQMQVRAAFGRVGCGGGWRRSAVLRTVGHGAVAGVIQNDSRAVLWSPLIWF